MGGLHQEQAVASGREADALAQGRKKSQANAESEGTGRGALEVRSPNVRKEADGHADQNDPAEEDLIGRQLVRVPDPRHHGGDRRRDCLFDQRRERSTKPRQGGEQRQAAHTEADRAGADEEQRLPAQTLTEGEGPDPQDDDGE